MQARIKRVMQMPGNDECVQCGARRPTWASVSFGVTLCLNCAGEHRGLGVHNSFVRSLTLDDWDEDQIRRMEAGGNRRFLEHFECIHPVPAALFCSDEGRKYKDQLLTHTPTDIPRPPNSSSSISETASSARPTSPSPLEFLMRGSPPPTTPSRAQSPQPSLFDFSSSSTPSKPRTEEKMSINGLLGI